MVTYEGSVPETRVWPMLLILSGLIKGCYKNRFVFHCHNTPVFFSVFLRNWSVSYFNYQFSKLTDFSIHAIFSPQNHKIYQKLLKFYSLCCLSKYKTEIATTII